MDLPSHPDLEDEEPHREPAPSGNWASVVFFVIMGVLFAFIVVLHLTGVVGPRAH